MIGLRVGVLAPDLMFFFCKLKTAYEVRIRYWSSDVGSSDLYVLPQASPTIQAEGWVHRACSKSCARRRQKDRIPLQSASSAWTRRVHRIQSGKIFVP